MPVPQKLVSVAMRGFQWVFVGVWNDNCFSSMPPNHFPHRFRRASDQQRLLQQFLVVIPVEMVIAKISDKAISLQVLFSGLGKNVNIRFFVDWYFQECCWRLGSVSVRGHAFVTVMDEAKLVCQVSCALPVSWRSSRGLSPRYAHP
jgi:hypothetical protein